MVDAVSGAIYVIGGRSGTTNFNDVWASTDGGARAGLRRGVHWVGTTRVLTGTKGTQGYYVAVLQGYNRGYSAVLQGY